MVRKAISKYYLFLLALYGALLLLPLFLKIIGPHAPSEMIPSLPLLLLWIVPIFFLSRICNIFNQTFGLAWALWFVVGSVNLIASYDYYGESYRLNADTPALIYILFLSAILAGIYLAERNSNRDKHRDDQNLRFQSLTPYFSSVLLIFPFIWFGSLVLSLGYVPILRAWEGENVVLSMYALDYGPLYGYMLVNSLSLLMAFAKFYIKKGTARYFYLCLIIVFAFFVIASGKRHIIILSMLSILAYLFYTKRITVSQALSFFIIIGGLYMGLEILRQGSEATKFSSFTRKFLTIGHEYRAFAYVVNHLKPGEIAGYNWAASTLAAAVNEGVLLAIGFDKNALIQMSSAYAWRYIFYSEFGIRSNLTAELYMAYGWAGMPLAFIFGMVVGWISKWITMTRSRDNLIFLCVAYATLMLTLVDSFNDVVGSLTLLFYVWVINRLIRLFVFGLLPSRSRWVYRAAQAGSDAANDGF
ncbi:MAG: oligosaccharide repeat unit polymerase [Thermoflexales bacterium]|nr:oligosaccharide repeat unit polymerase [Thermoflexales bacterium]